MSSNIKSSPASTPDTDISYGASDAAQPMRNEATVSDAGTNAPHAAPLFARRPHGVQPEGDITMIAHSAGRSPAATEPISASVALAEAPGDLDHAAPADSATAAAPTAAPPEGLINPQAVYSGVWIQSTAGQFLRLNRDYNAFMALYGEMYGQNFKVASLSSYVLNGAVYYNATFNPQSTGQYLRLNRDSAGLVTEYGLQWDKGFRLAALDSYMLNGKVFYNATWNPSTAGQYLRLDRTFDQFLAEYGEMYGKNFKLAALTSYVLNGIVYYSATYNPSTAGQYLRLDRTADTLWSEMSWMTSNGFRLAVWDSYVRNGQTYYNAAYNPGTGVQHLELDAPYQDLMDAYGTQWNKNRRLLVLLTDKVEGLSRKTMAQKISAALAPNVTGMAAMVGSAGGKAGSDEGLRRTSTNQPLRYASVWARTNVASVSKTVTAVTTIAALGAHALTIASRIHPYLPSDWVRGPNIDTITFQELLTHTSGLRAPTGTGVGYNDLRNLIAKGIALADKKPSYLNHNFALLRVLIPYVNGFNENGVTDKDLATATAYLAYVNQRVLAPCGIPEVGLKPAASEPTLCYPFPAGAVHGTDWGDQTRFCGSSGLHLSADELATFLVHLFERDTILNSVQRQLMTSNLLGWQGSTAVRHGTALSHNGYLFMPTPNGNAELNSLILSFSVGAQLGLIVNSRVGNSVNVFQVAIDAYNDSWIPLT